MSEMQEYQTNHPSKVPSWVTLGFVVGVLTMWLFQSRDSGDKNATVEVPEEPPTAQEMVANDPNPMVLADRPSLEVVEALFDQYRDYAFWSDDRSEIALWNSKTLEFSDFFEVVSTETGTYYRSIRRFSRLPLEGYGPSNSPILFTETAEQMAKRFYKANPDKVPKKGLRTPIEFDQLPQPPTSGGE